MENQSMSAKKNTTGRKAKVTQGMKTTERKIVAHKKEVTSIEETSIEEQAQKFHRLMEADDSPASVRSFIGRFADALASYAGMTGEEYDEEGIEGIIPLAVQHVGTDALLIALRVAVDTLTSYSPAVSRDTRSDYQRRADQFATALLHPQCPESFRIAFQVIYNDLLVSKAEWTHPDMVRATYAPMREWLDEANYCGTAEGVDESLLRLMETLLPEEVQEAARIASKGQPEKAGALSS
jgi:hydrogenase maturation factor HypF (carbamoyltransferase family)